jgi:hypothetical protein
MSKHGREPFVCRCGRESRQPVIVRGLRLCPECAIDEGSVESGGNMQRWDGEGWKVRPLKVRRIG